MYLALFSVGIGSGLTLLQAAALFYFLDLDRYVAFRAVLNTMNVAAPFLCMGFDSSAPVLRRLNEGFPFFWNMILVQGALCAILVLFATAMPAGSEFRPLVLGTAAGTSIAAALMVANHYRTSGGVQRYFMHVNVVDKLARTIIIIGMAFFLRDVFLWSVTIAVFGFAYVLYSSAQTKIPMHIDMGIFRQHLVVSFPYIFSAMGIIVLTRVPFYAAYLSDTPMVTAKVDIWLLFSLLLLVPTLNRSKMEEARSRGVIRPYVEGMHGGWRTLRAQELLVGAGILVVAALAVIFGKADREDLLTIVLPLMIGMLLIASLPNYVQGLCFAQKVWSGIQVSLGIVVITLVSYLPRLFVPKLPISFLFVGSAVAYCLLGCAVARKLDIPLSIFWRWRDAVKVAAILTIGMGCVFAALGP